MFCRCVGKFISVTFVSLLIFKTILVMFKEKRLIYKEEAKEEDLQDVPNFWRNVRKEHAGCGVGFVVTKDPTKQAVDLAVAGLCGMKDRTGVAFGTGDGAGIIMNTDGARGYFERFLPPDTHVEKKDQLSVGMIFFEPQLGENPTQQMNQIRRIMTEQGIYVHGWRKVPVDNSVLPNQVRGLASHKWQLLYSPGSFLKNNKEAYNRMLLFAQRRIDGDVKGATVVSLNASTMTMKAMSTPDQFRRIFAEDLNHPDFISKQVGFHARMRSAGVTADENAQPFDFLWENGQNTADGALSSAQADLERRMGITGMYEDSVTVPHGASDSRKLNGMGKVLNYHGIQGRGALRRHMLPSMDDRLRMPPKVQKYLEDIWRTRGPLSARQGPGAVLVMTGNRIAFAMDPLGLRTLWIYGNNNIVAGCSEVGEVPIPIDEIEFLYQMEGGQLGEVNRGRFVTPSHVDELMADANPIKIFGDSRILDLNGHPFKITEKEGALEKLKKEDVVKMWNQIGGDEYALEVVRHMAAYGKEPVEGMGDNRPLAILSPARVRMASYFAQIVGIVTDPPMDSLREGGAMDLRVTLGRDPKQIYPDNPNEYKAEPEFVMDSPFMNLTQMNDLKSGKGFENGEGPKHVTIDTTFEMSMDGDVAAASGADMEKKLDEIVAMVLDQAEHHSEPIIIFDDSKCKTSERLFVHPVLIASACNYALRQRGLRDNVKLVFNTMDAIEAHDMALLVSQGADAVCPYMLWEAVENDFIEYTKGDKYKTDLKEGNVGEISLKKRMSNVQLSLDETLKKVMSKQGLSTVHGYRGLCLFEILGIDSKVSEKYFKYNPSRIGGIDFDDMVEDQVERLKEKRSAFRKVSSLEANARFGKVANLLNQFLLGQYKLENNVYSPNEDYNPEAIYRELAKYIGEERGPVALRNLLGFNWASEREGAEELDIKDVESVASIICRHFRGSHMSDGALGPVAHAAIAVAINDMAKNLMPQLHDPASLEINGQFQLNFVPKDADSGYSERLDPRPKSGSGEGGEHKSRRPGGDFEEACSKSKQIASGRFGVDAYYIMSVGDDGEMNIKIGQGAKPGQGGHVNGSKIDDRLAEQRGTVAGMDLISPPTQHDIYNIEDLMRLIWDIRAVNPNIKTVSVKVTSKAGIGSIACGVAKCGADKIVMSGRDGGTGAAEASAARHTGAPLELGIFEAFTMLRRAGMIDKVLMEVDGGIVTGTDIAQLAIMGADEFGFGTSLLQGGEGCILCKRCADGRISPNDKSIGCPVGICISAKDAIAYLGLGSKAAHLLKDDANVMTYVQQLVLCKKAITNYWTEVAKDVQQILAKLGVKSLEELRGRFDLLKRLEGPNVPGDKSKKVDLDFLWSEGMNMEGIQDFGDLPIAPKKAVNATNQAMIDAAMAYTGEGPFEMEISMPGDKDFEAKDADNSMRTIGGTLAGLIASGKLVPPEGGYNFKLKGYVGQTFGFCLVPGINLELTGIARDFVGEAMCGGEIVIKPPVHLASRAVPLAGASCAYGARGGKLFIAGKAGQRFGVRNSGGQLVSEGVGKYAFEYMTGGTGVVLGETGYEVGSGMFGGELFLWNGNDDVQNKLFKGQKKPKWMSDEEWGERKQAVPMVADMSEEDYGKLWNIIKEHADKTGSLKAKVILEDWDNMKFKFAKVVPNNKPKPPVITELGKERQRRGGEFPMMPKK